MLPRAMFCALSGVGPCENGESPQRHDLEEEAPMPDCLLRSHDDADGVKCGVSSPPRSRMLFDDEHDDDESDADDDDDVRMAAAHRTEDDSHRNFSCLLAATFAADVAVGKPDEKPSLADESLPPITLLPSHTLSCRDQSTSMSMRVSLGTLAAVAKHARPIPMIAMDLWIPRVVSAMAFSGRKPLIGLTLPEATLLLGVEDEFLSESPSTLAAASTCCCSRLQFSAALATSKSCPCAVLRRRLIEAPEGDEAGDVCADAVRPRRVQKECHELSTDSPSSSELLPGGSLNMKRPSAWATSSPVSSSSSSASIKNLSIKSCWSIPAPFTEFFATILIALAAPARTSAPRLKISLLLTLVVYRFPPLTPSFPSPFTGYPQTDARVCWAACPAPKTPRVVCTVRKFAVGSPE